MGNIKIVKIKRLWNKLASVRDYQVENCIESQDILRIHLEETGEYMDLPPEELKEKMFQVVPKKLRSRFTGKEYSLVDFAWRPTNA